MKVLELILEYIKALTWPLIVLLMLIIFHAPIGDILSSIKKVELPYGISLETFNKDLEKATVLSENISQEIREDSKRKGSLIQPSVANSRMLELGLLPSPSGLQISYYRSLAKQDPNLALVALRLEVDAMLKNLAKGFNVPISNYDSTEIIASKLRDRNAITSQQYDFISKILSLCTAAIHGLRVSQTQVDDILDIATVLRDAYVAWLSWGFPNK